MSKQSLLLVDGDTRSLRVLEVSLRKAGFSVTPAVSVSDALDKLQINAPDLIISETKFSTELDGFELRRRLRNSPEWADIPFIFLTAETAIENKIKGLELGVDDYLTKPIYIKEIVTRINILLQKRQRQFLDMKKDGTRFAGRVSDMPVVDVIQTIEVSRKSGVIQFSNGPTRTATIYFRDGRVIDAEAGTLQGEDAVYRLLTWNEGEFEVEFRTVRRREVISTSSQGLLMEGMRRLDEWSRLLEQLPPLSHRFEIDTAELASRLGEIPDDNNRILRLFDGRRTLLEVIDASDFGDLECLQAISRLYFEGLLIDLDPGVRSKRDTGKSGPHLLVESPPVTPIEEVVSGPIDIAGLEARVAARDATTSTAVAEPAPVMTTTAEPLHRDSAERMRRDSAERMRRDSAERMRRDSAERMRRDSAQAIDEGAILSEEEIRGPLTGGYRPSSLRLIDEAVAAAQAIEPSLFEPGELEALGLGMNVPGMDPVTEEPKPEPVVETPLARVKLEKRVPDPRIENARAIVEKTPALDERPGPNGEPREAPGAKKKSVPLHVSPAHAKEPAAFEPKIEPTVETKAEPKIETKVEPEQRAAALPALTRAPTPPTLTAKPFEPRPSIGAPGTEPAVETKPAPTPTFARPQPSELKPALEMKAVEPTDDASSGVPTAIEPLPDEGPTDPSRRPYAPPRREDSSGIRMIGSQGRDRAEASGEVRMATYRAPTAENEPQRELVTILPRRITREIAVQTPEGETVEVSPDAVEAKPASAPPPAEPAKPAVEPPRAPPRRVEIAGGVVRAPRGPGRLAQLLLLVAAGLVGVTTYTYCKKKPPVNQPVASTKDDAALISTETPDAEVVDTAVALAPEDARTPIDAAVVAVARPDAAPRPDAAVVATVRPDAAPRADASEQVATAVDAGVDKGKEAKALYEKGHTALEDGDAQQALDYLEQSLKLKRQSKTLLERARALQRLNRVDDAVASIDEAIAMNKSYAPAYEKKGMLLWSAQRYDEARPAFEKFLELDPNSPKADTIRAMLDEHK